MTSPLPSPPLVRSAAHLADVPGSAMAAGSSLSASITRATASMAVSSAIPRRSWAVGDQNRPYNDEKLRFVKFALLLLFRLGGRVAPTAFVTSKRQMRRAAEDLPANGCDHGRAGGRRPHCQMRHAQPALDQALGCRWRATAAVLARNLAYQLEGETACRGIGRDCELQDALPVDDGVPQRPVCMASGLREHLHDPAARPHLIGGKAPAAGRR